MDHVTRQPVPRLFGFDYATPRAYFVTVCTAGRRPVLSDIDESGFSLTPLGAAVARELEGLPARFHHVSVEPAKVLMPDHLHAILWLPENSPLCLQSVVGLFKAGCTRECRRLGLMPASWGTLWQRSFYDRIIRTEQELSTVRRYIHDNPRRWFERQRGAG